MQQENIPIITLDGPGGTGKGTLCQMLANHLHWHLLDSGSLYRVLAYLARKNKVSLEDTKNLIPLANNLPVVFATKEDQKILVYLQDEDVTEAIRSETVGQDASLIAACPEVRTALLFRQRAFAKRPGLVADGRDMGTVVFPQALLKIYLDATPEERAKRRYLQLKRKGMEISLQQVNEELEIRDERDKKRLHAPLQPAKDAFYIDTTGLTVVQVFRNVLELLQAEKASFFL